MGRSRCELSATPTPNELSKGRCQRRCHQKGFGRDTPGKPLPLQAGASEEHEREGTRSRQVLGCRAGRPRPVPLTPKTGPRPPSCPSPVVTALRAPTSSGPRPRPGPCARRPGPWCRAGPWLPPARRPAPAAGAAGRPSGPCAAAARSACAAAGTPWRCGVPPRRRCGGRGGAVSGRRVGLAGRENASVPDQAPLPRGSGHFSQSRLWDGRSPVQGEVHRRLARGEGGGCVCGRLLRTHKGRPAEHSRDTAGSGTLKPPPGRCPSLPPRAQSRSRPQGTSSVPQCAGLAPSGGRRGRPGPPALSACPASSAPPPPGPWGGRVTRQGPRLPTAPHAPQRTGQLPRHLTCPCSRSLRVSSRSTWARSSPRVPRSCWADSSRRACSFRASSTCCREAEGQAPGGTGGDGGPRGWQRHVAATVSALSGGALWNPPKALERLVTRWDARTEDGGRGWSEGPGRRLDLHLLLHLPLHLQEPLLLPAGRLLLRGGKGHPLLQVWLPGQGRPEIRPPPAPSPGRPAEPAWP